MNYECSLKKVTGVRVRGVTKCYEQHILQIEDDDSDDDSNDVDDDIPAGVVSASK